MAALAPVAAANYTMWLEPDLVAEVAFQEWTRTGELR